MKLIQELYGKGIINEEKKTQLEATIKETGKTEEAVILENKIKAIQSPYNVILDKNFPVLPYKALNQFDNNGFLNENGIQIDSKRMANVLGYYFDGDSQWIARVCSVHAESIEKGMRDCEHGICCRIDEFMVIYRGSIYSGEIRSSTSF